MKKIAVRHNPRTQRVDRVQCFDTLKDAEYEADECSIRGPSWIRTGYDADLNVTAWIETTAAVDLFEGGLLTVRCP